MATVGRADAQRTLELPSPSRDDEHRRLLRALGSVGSALANTTDYEQALRALTESMCRIVDAKAGGVMLYDEVTDELVLQKPAFGVYADDVVGAYRVPLSAGGNAVRVFLSQTSSIGNEVRSDPRYIQRFVEMFDTYNTLTIPLRVGDRAVGVFHAINKRSGPFTDDDRATLEQLSPLLASGVHAARAFRRTQEEHRRLERAMFVHRELSRTTFEGRGLAPLAAVLGRLVGRPVLVFDADLHLVASAGDVDAALTAALRDELEGRADATRSSSSLQIALGPSETSLACSAPLTVGDELGGYLVVRKEGPEDARAIDLRVLDSAASVFTLELLNERATFEVKKRLVGDLLQDLVDERRPADPAVVRRRLGCTAAAPWRAVCVRVHAATPRGGTRVAHVTPVIDRALRDAFAEVGVDGALSPWRSGFVAVLGHADVARLRDGALAEEVTEALASARRDPGLSLSLQWGVGEVARDERHIAESIATAEQALVAAERLAIAARPVFFDELGIYRLLLSTDPARDHAAFVERVLGAVCAADTKKRGGRLMETLEVLVDAGFRPCVTAQRLGVHVNTLKYRLRRLSEILGGDPSQGELRLEIELALRITKLKRAGLGGR